MASHCASNSNSIVPISSLSLVITRLHSLRILVMLLPLVLLVVLLMVHVSDSAAAADDDAYHSIHCTSLFKGWFFKNTIPFLDALAFGPTLDAPSVQ